MLCYYRSPEVGRGRIRVTLERIMEAPPSPSMVKTELQISAMLVFHSVEHACVMSQSNKVLSSLLCGNVHAQD